MYTKNFFTIAAGLLVVAVIGGMVATNAQAQTISWNWDGWSGGGTPGPVTGVAGAIPVGNWNNSGTDTTGGPFPMIDSTGAATGATVQWTSGNHWNTSGGDTGGTDAQMMQGYLDNMHTQPPITVNNLPAAFTNNGYELRMYHNTDSGGTMGFTVDDGNGPTTYYSHQPGGNNSNFPLAGVDPFGGAAGFIGSQDPNSGHQNASNYTLFTGLTGANLSIQAVAGTFGDGRSRPNAFQITALEPAAAIPEPSSVALWLITGLAGIVYLGWRRRRRQALP